jgi:hypothetical protein
MTRARRVRVLASTPLLILAFVLAAPLPGGAAPPQDRAATARITSAANVTVRSQPSMTAANIAQVPLGTEMGDAGPAGLDKTWVRVRLGDGREGWLLASLTKPLDPAWRWPTYDRIIAERLGRKGDGFPALAELVSFIERVAPDYTDPDGRARVELARLKAISATLAAIPAGGWNREPYASWLAPRKPELCLDRPGGRWIQARPMIWDLYNLHASSTSADDIAWFAVTNGLEGECGGQLVCYVQWRDRLQGEYLRRQPAGRHVEEAVAAIKELADLVVQPRKSSETWAFDAASDGRDATASIDALTAAVKATRAANRDAAIASLAALRKFCQ